MPEQEAEPSCGVVYDLDGLLGISALRHPIRTARRVVGRSPRDLRSVLGLAGVVRTVARDTGAVAVYLTSAPRPLRRAIRKALDQDGYPAGAVETTAGVAPVRTSQARLHKQSVLRRLLVEHPHLSWVLVGDDGGDDPLLFAELARSKPDRVAAIVLRQVSAPAEPVDPSSPCGDVGAVPVVAAPNGQQLIPLVASCLGKTQDEPGSATDWFLAAHERGNDATRLRAWTAGNTVRPLVHGQSYFPALAGELSGVGAGAVVAFTAWRIDADQRLTADGPGVAQLLAAAASRGAAVRGLVWRSHTARLGFSAPQNRRVAGLLRGSGGEVLLDQRVRAFGSHHQKLVVVRHPRTAGSDVAFVGGIDLAHGRRDDRAHEGDDQSIPLAGAYGPRPAWHDVQLEMRGPAVADAEHVFRERWEDPTPLSRLPWQVAADFLRGAARHPAPLEEPFPDPPATGTCDVQLLRTYPHRWPGYPFAPRGERSIARGYAKALERAQRLIYVEDQYLWSSDVARVFAAVLHARPQLHLVAVAPRVPEREGAFQLPPALLGQSAALDMVREAGGSRVLVVDLENREGTPVYVHAKVCIVDDVWAAVGSSNFNRRSWTHDSELTAAVLDRTRDRRAPADPAGRGDGARRFARELRLELMREHLERAAGDDADLIDPAEAVAALRTSAEALEAWYQDGVGARPRGRLRLHATPDPPARLRWLTALLNSSVVDPDGRALGMRLRRTF